MQSLPPAGQLAKVFSLQENTQPAEFVLEADVCTIGRSVTCDIVITQRQTVSRLHAKIERKGPRYVLRDASSANGTFVNGSRIYEPHLLGDDDVIGLGTPTALLRFSDPDPTAQIQAQLSYDGRTMTFFLNRQAMHLTPGEFRLLNHLYQHSGDVCTRESCAMVIWQRAYDPGPDDEGLYRTVSNLRRKLRELDPTIDPAEIIKTRRGLGYELVF
jgi:DNA-binding response OmpR family regulator